MDIKTRFDCGQLVYLIDDVGNKKFKWLVTAQAQIHGINIRIINNKARIYYTIEIAGNRYPDIKESHLFTTRKQAQASCDSRNDRIINCK